MSKISPRKILVITGGGLNTRFNTDIPKYLLPTKNSRTILRAIIDSCKGFDEIVLIVNEFHERMWNVSSYVNKQVCKTVKCVVLEKQTKSPVETIYRSGVLQKYKNDKIYFKDCDTVYKIKANADPEPETFVVKKFGFQVSGKYSIVNKDGSVVEKPKIPWYKWLHVYKANIGTYVFPPCGGDFRDALFMTNIDHGSVGNLCGRLKPRVTEVKDYINFESLLMYGKIVSKQK